MNPSTEDILREVERTPAEIVYVLPNNKNIIMAAQQCQRLCEDKKVVVLPTKTVPQGISPCCVPTRGKRGGEHRRHDRGLFPCAHQRGDLRRPGFRL